MLRPGFTGGELRYGRNMPDEAIAGMKGRSNAGLAVHQTKYRFGKQDTASRPRGCPPLIDATLESEQPPIAVKVAPRLVVVIPQRVEG